MKYWYYSWNNRVIITDDNLTEYKDPDSVMWDKLINSQSEIITNHWEEMSEEEAFLELI